MTKMILKIRKAECCKQSTGKFQDKLSVKMFWFCYSFSAGSFRKFGRKQKWLKEESKKWLPKGNHFFSTSCR
jgi:hypothetical protein